MSEDEIDPEVLALLLSKASPRKRLREFERRWQRPPTVAEIRLDFDEDETSDDDRREYCLDPVESIHVLFKRIRELERELEERDGRARPWTQAGDKLDKPPEKLTIVRWVSFDEASKLPSVERGIYDNATLDHQHVLLETLQAQGLKFSGARYQESHVPVFSDGSTILCTQRRWGSYMVAVWGGSYLDWAWDVADEVLPEPPKDNADD